MRRPAVLVAAAIIALIAGCGGASHAGDAQPSNVVVLKNIAFNPSTVTIRAGQQVVWKFEDGGVPHNVTGTDFTSAIMGSGSYAHTFSAPGTYQYQCTIHSGMTGQVVVTP
jgi:plastocyanin